MLHKLEKRDFAVLRGPLESGRQSPDSLSIALILSLFLQPLTYYITYHVAAETTNYPNVDRIQTIHFWFSACLLVLTVIYSSRFIYIRSQKIQYAISILFTQNMGISFYLCVLFLIGDIDSLPIESLIHFTIVTSIIACLLFIATCIRFYILLVKGHYRRGSKKGELRENFETTSYIPLAIIASTGLVFILQYLIRTFDWQALEDFTIIFLGMGIFYTMIFVLPEQLVILYCKCRFKNFNFHKSGVLKRR